MRSKGLLIFDGDDTLWRVEQLYDAALSEAELAVSESGLPGAEWRLLQREFDLLNVRAMGMSQERFPLSSREALLEVGRRHGVVVSAELSHAIERASRSVFTMKAPVVPHAPETLQMLAPHFHLVLLTKGDEVVQQRRVNESGLNGWFERVEIVGEKTDAPFSQLVEQFDVAADRSWSIGNSLVSDINPALRVGLNAIWIEAHVWEHERRELSPLHPRLVTLERLEQVAQVLLAPVRMESMS
jgi:putative hydrolase of the HAD superfamily